MKIECKLKRDGGTHVDIDTIKYHFAPQADGAHVADVTEEAHVDRFLSIAEAYRLYRGEKAAVEVKEEAQSDADPVPAAPAKPAKKK